MKKYLALLLTLSLLCGLLAACRTQPPAPELSLIHISEPTRL